MDRYRDAASYADSIERELHTLKAWQSEPLASVAYESQTAFYADTMTFCQWLQFIFLPRVRETVEQRGAFPRESSVGAYAVRELDGLDGADGLVQVLSEFDDFIEGLHRGSRKGL